MAVASQTQSNYRLSCSAPTGLVVAQINVAFEGGSRAAAFYGHLKQLPVAEIALCRSHSLMMVTRLVTDISI
jgi:hypothetical protein